VDREGENGVLEKQGGVSQEGVRETKVLPKNYSSVGELRGKGEQPPKKFRNRINETGRSNGGSSKGGGRTS